jgi:S1-C subfamily serine protease
MRKLKVPMGIMITHGNPRYMLSLEEN